MATFNFDSTCVINGSQEGTEKSTEDDLHIYSDSQRYYNKDQFGK